MGICSIDGGALGWRPGAAVAATSRIPVRRSGAMIPLTDDEQAAIDDGSTALDRLLDRLADIPTPAGPTPRQLDLPAGAVSLPVIDVRQARARPIRQS